MFFLIAWTDKIVKIDASFIPFLVFGHFWQRSYENTKILRNLCLHFARQDGKNRKENQASKVTKIPKTKGRKFGMNKTSVQTLHTSNSGFFCFVHPIFLSFGFWYFGHFSCVIFFPSCPSCLAKCKQRLCNIFIFS